MFVDMIDWIMKLRPETFMNSDLTRRKLNYKERPNWSATKARRGGGCIKSNNGNKTKGGFRTTIRHKQVSIMKKAVHFYANILRKVESKHLWLEGFKERQRAAVDKESKNAICLLTDPVARWLLALLSSRCSICSHVESKSTARRHSFSVSWNPL